MEASLRDMQALIDRELPIVPTQTKEVAWDQMSKRKTYVLREKQRDITKGTVARLPRIEKDGELSLGFSDWLFHLDEIPLFRMECLLWCFVCLAARRTEG